MSEIAFLNDLHFGLSNAAGIYENEIKLFLEDVFFPELDKGTYKTVFIAGDVFHDRTSINIRTMNMAKEILFDRLESMKIPTFVSLGNHDLFYKHKLHPNSVTPILKEYEYVVCVDEPTPVNVNGKSFLVVPWICRDNEDWVLTEIQDSDARFLVGHLELSGAILENGRESHGMSPSIFGKFDRVYSGHYHGRTMYGNICYMGTQYHMTRSDTNVTKGFQVMHADGTDGFIRNPRKLYTSVDLADDKIEGWDAVEWLMANEDEVLDGRIVTFNFADSCTPDFIERTISLIEASPVANYKIVDMSKEELVSKDIEIRAASTMEMVNTYVDEKFTGSDFDLSIMKGMLRAAYEEATGVSGNV